MRRCARGNDQDLREHAACEIAIREHHRAVYPPHVTAETRAAKEAALLLAATTGGEKIMAYADADMKAAGFVAKLLEEARAFKECKLARVKRTLKTAMLGALRLALYTDEPFCENGFSEEEIWTYLGLDGNDDVVELPSDAQRSRLEDPNVCRRMGGCLRPWCRAGGSRGSLPQVALPKGRAFVSILPQSI